MATETPGMVCGPTTGCGQTTPMVPTRIHTVNGIENGWQAPAACSRCGKPFGFFSLINNPPPIAPLSPWFVFASSLGEPVSQEAPGLPPGESPQRNAVCDALTEALLYIGVGCGEACERTTIDLEDRVEVRGLARMMTVRDPEGLDGSLGENTKKLWERIGAALAPISPVISSASPLSEDTKRLDFLQAWCDDMFWQQERNAVGEPRLMLSWFIGDGGSPAFSTTGDDWRDAIDQARVKMGDIDRLSASAPSPEDKGSRC